MTKFSGTATIKVEKFCTVFIVPFAVYRRVGEISRLTVLGVPVYQRVGDVKRLFGFTYGA